MHMKTTAKRIDKSEAKPAQREPRTERSPAIPQSGPAERRLLTGIKRMDETFNEPATRSGGTGQQRICFEMSEPSANRVCIAGSFNDWNPQATVMVSLGGGKWMKDLMLPPGTYEYRFVVDGKWIPDPNASHSVPNPFGEPNSLLSVPGEQQAMQQ